MDEIFLEDDETGLLVSNLGRVVGPRAIRKPDLDQHGYERIGYYWNGKKGHVFVHRLVARNFIPNPLNLPVINHRDENPCNNRVDNLEWCTYKYNNNYGTCRERILSTRIKNGSKTCPVKVTLWKCENSQSFSSMSQAAKALGITLDDVWSIVRGKAKSAKGWHLYGVKPEKVEKRKVKLIKYGEVREFESLHEAERTLGVPASNLCRVLYGRRKSVHGWKTAM